MEFQEQIDKYMKCYFIVIIIFFFGFLFKRSNLASGEIKRGDGRFSPCKNMFLHKENCLSPLLVSSDVRLKNDHEIRLNQKLFLLDSGLDGLMDL